MNRIGISVDSDVLRAVVVRGGDVVWSGEVRVRDPKALSSEIAGLITSVPRTRWRRPAVTGTIGSRAAQLKRINGLPANASDRALSDAIRLSAPRFFLTNGSPLLTSNIHRRDGDLWCAAADEDVVTALADACRATGMAFRGCVPSAAAARGVAPPSGEYARFADARAAAIGGAHSPFLIDPGAPARARQRRARDRALLVACAVVAFVAAFVMPGIKAIVRERDAAARLQALRGQSIAPMAAMRDFTAAAELVRRVEAFSSSRRSMVTLLGALSQVLPESTAILSFHADSAGGTLVLLTPVGNTVLPEISRAPGIVSADITGAVTRETVAGAPVERVATAFRFVRPRPPRRPGPPEKGPGGTR